ncbi:DUF262 domain-containing protein [Sulfitobacter sp. CW3]|uniref:DUF262 domain-containing protein n=1 Tax=Sulfitobacter sp. CW3 TaxID=2861965 RepID=UPI001C5FFB9A|nr:DUF262 domain-containing protein [Sulfitobacter sp. CW3]MBW4961552.1 DUF262 domain-containing HNH endonuclease family protein [Sulfitobacter sp. CW3]
MHPTYIEIAQVFSQDQRYTVPLFQRPYVWNKEDQWEPLWSDILGVLGRLQRRKDDAVVASHFLGTIVLEQRQTPTGSLPKREVIDGQQRLTTLQILLKAVEHAIGATLESSPEDERDAIELAKRQISKLTKNDALGEEVYKVWPTNEDRKPFSEVMDAIGFSAATVKISRMANAYQYFYDAAGQFLASADSHAEMAKLLSEAVRNYMRLIVLDLDKGDEPQAIFETLNAHGTPLLPTDLIKNWLLWEAARQKLDATPLYESYWCLFDRDHDYWRATVGTGHAARARVDTFLQNWLSKETGEAVSAKHLYDLFLRYAERLQPNTGAVIDVANLMEKIHIDALRFERIDKPLGSTRFDVFLERLKRLGIVVFHPLLLEVIARTEEHPEDTDEFGKILESYLVRRLVCGAQTRSYGSLSLSILNTLREHPEMMASEVLRDALSSLTGADEWPSDEAFRHSWITRRFYGYFKRDRVLMILQALEHKLQTANDKAEPIISFDWSQLQIEHIMPQAWEAHWPLPEGINAEARRLNVQGIGNLTLVSKKLNPRLSNSPWSAQDKSQTDKRSGLHDHTMLMINRNLLDEFPNWNDEAIQTRAKNIFDDAKVIWAR